jgi:hypothetical protein
LQPLAESGLVVVDMLESGHNLDSGLGAALTLLFQLADAGVVACAIGSSEPVARTAKSFERFHVSFIVLLEAIDIIEKTIEIRAHTKVATRQCQGSRRQDRASPGDADPVKPGW